MVFGRRTQGVAPGYRILPLWGGRIAKRRQAGGAGKAGEREHGGHGVWRVRCLEPKAECVTPWTHTGHLKYKVVMSYAQFLGNRVTPRREFRGLGFAKFRGDA